MARLVKKAANQDREITDAIYTEANEYFKIIDWGAPKYLKNLMEKNYYSIDELLKTEHDELTELIKATMKQIQSIFDTCYDQFYSGPPGTNTLENDPTNPSSDTYINVCNYIDNFEQYNNKPLVDLVLKNKTLVKYLKSK